MENNNKQSNILPLVVIFVVVAGLIGGAYWFGKSSIMQKSPKEEVSDVKDSEEIAVNEETKKEETAEVPDESEESAKEDLIDKETEDTEEVVEEETDEEVIEILKILFAKKYENRIDDVTVTISKREGDYLTGGVKFAGEGAGGYVLAAKVNGAWKIIFDGNGSISCSSIDVVDFPSTLVSDCWDEDTMTSVDRTAK